jgi:hypothetical protein
MVISSPLETHTPARDWLFLLHPGALMMKQSIPAAMSSKVNSLS